MSENNRGSPCNACPLKYALFRCQQHRCPRTNDASVTSTGLLTQMSNVPSPELSDNSKPFINGELAMLGFTVRCFKYEAESIHSNVDWDFRINFQLIAIMAVEPRQLHNYDQL